MASILDNDRKGCYLIYGNTNDMFLGSDLVPKPFWNYLADYLRQIGYDRVVFYSSEQNYGKFVVDDDSAKKIFSANLKHLLKGINGDGGENEKENKPKRPSTKGGKKRKKMGPQSELRTGDGDRGASGGTGTGSGMARTGSSGDSDQFGMQGQQTGTDMQTGIDAQTGTDTQTGIDMQIGIDAQTGIDAQNGIDAQAGSGQQSEQEEKLTYNAPRRSLAEFLDDCKQYLREDEYSTAIVFLDIASFFSSANLVLAFNELVMNELNAYRSNKNRTKCIFVSSSAEESCLNQDFSRLSMTKHFFSSVDDKVFKNDDACIFLGLPGDDEIRLLLEYLRIVGIEARSGRKKITFRRSELPDIVQAIKYTSQSISSKHNNVNGGLLFGIMNEMESYMQKRRGNSIPIDPEVIAHIFKAEWKQDEDPLERLTQTKGWEKPAKRVLDYLNDFYIRKREFEDEQKKFAFEQEEDDRLVCECSRFREEGSLAMKMKYPAPNFVFLGNPGVGKTTIANCMGRILAREGILSNGNPYVVRAGDLVSGYVGHTKEKVQQAIKQAKGRVFLVDEVYELLTDESQERGGTNANEQLKRDALDALMQALDAPDICVIFAGYTKKTRQLLEKNPGMKSRFKHENIIEIDDYPPDVLQEHFEHLMEKHQLVLDRAPESDGFIDLELFFRNLYAGRSRSSFGNMRDVETIADNVLMSVRSRSGDKKTVVKADFGDHVSCFEKRGGKDSLETIFKELDEMVGLENVRKEFESVYAEELLLKEQEALGSCSQDTSGHKHYILVGKPGTGKTTIGKKLGRFLFAMGVIGSPELKIVDASSITRPEDAVKIIDEARDKNQFVYIDEANYFVKNGNYGAQLISPFLMAMTEYANEFRVGFGIYPNNEDGFAKLDSGLLRRCHVIRLKDYDGAELYEIFDRLREKQHLTLGEGVEERVRLILTQMYEIGKSEPNFGNADEANTLLKQMNEHRILRCQNMPYSGQRMILQMEDIPKEKQEMVAHLVKPKTIEEIEAMIDTRIGLDALKKLVLSMKNQIDVNAKILESNRIRGTKYRVQPIYPGYYFFTGKPGTGKTTSAKIFAECLCALGIIKTPKYLEKRAKDLISEYMGATDKKAGALLESGRNGVLMIDEAYALAYSKNSMMGHDYREQAVNEIIGFMDSEENRKECCIIFCGYKEDMERLYDTNEGFRSRVQEVAFRNYTADEAYQIFELFAKENGWTLAEGMKEAYLPLFELAESSPYYSNARTARTIFEQTRNKHTDRMMQNMSGGEGGELPDDLMELQICDCLKAQEILTLMKEAEVSQD